MAAGRDLALARARALVRSRCGAIVLLWPRLFLLRPALAAGTNLSRERHFYYWSGQFLLGGPAILLEALAGRARVAGELPLADVGLLYACMAGLLNVLAMLDVWGVAEARWLRTGETGGHSGIALDPARFSDSGETPA